MAPDNATTISVIDFRRHRMVLQWHALGGTWTPCDNPPVLVHGIALIRPSQPNICLYGLAGRLRLQVGSNQYALSENSPRISCVRGLASFGFRRRFTVKSPAAGFGPKAWRQRLYGPANKANVQSGSKPASSVSVRCRHAPELKAPR
jgi:hypothetical protein